MQFRPADSRALARWLIDVAKYWPAAGGVAYQMYSVSNAKARSLEVAAAIQVAKNTGTKKDVQDALTLMESLIREYPRYAETEIHHEAMSLQAHQQEKAEHSS